mgnify:CR=1 FL=1
MNKENLTAYEVVTEENLTDIHSTGWLLRHKKTGARVMLIENDDENKVFNIAFRTPPKDSTGVAHILEHSVLCGSREFPLKDPFVELVKGSLNTFLNAMTYPDKTCYPVASCNDKDFQNLMHVYLDAVFYPNIYKKEEIFRQEGWSYHLENTEGPLTYNGVVYNEMKGAFSSPDDVLERDIMNSLFPDITYGCESGGDPENIPDLSYEEFLDFHRTYYHPSNSYIYLYGDMDMAEKLIWLDENYLIYSELSEEGKFYLHLFCVNPAGCLQEYMGKGNSTILFSATFLPINYYKKLLSAEKDDYAIYAESPFEQSKRLLLLGNDVSTKYTRRGPEMYRKYAEYIMRVIKGRTGNYLAFFPSYRFLEEVWEAFMELPQEQIEVAVQSQYMTEQEREEFLKKFEQERAHSLIGFCVMGGIFSEGIDLTEDKLIGAMIIGTGLPQVCLERELLKYYFDRKNLNGFDYAYLYPGMNKVLQSAGRVIRTDQDRGVIALLDERFMDRRCQEVFPREWNDFQICNSENIEEKIAGFWKEEQMDKR